VREEREANGRGGGETAAQGIGTDEDVPRSGKGRGSPGERQQECAGGWRANDERAKGQNGAQRKKLPTRGGGRNLGGEPGVARDQQERKWAGSQRRVRGADGEGGREERGQVDERAGKEGPSENGSPFQALTPKLQKGWANGTRGAKDDGTCCERAAPLRRTRQAARTACRSRSEPRRWWQGAELIRGKRTGTHHRGGGDEAPTESANAAERTRRLAHEDAGRKGREKGRCAKETEANDAEGQGGGKRDGVRVR